MAKWRNQPITLRTPTCSRMKGMDRGFVIHMRPIALASGTHCTTSGGNNPHQIDTTTTKEESYT
jgi:hypothetical protein